MNQLRGEESGTTKLNSKFNSKSQGRKHTFLHYSAWPWCRIWLASRVMNKLSQQEEIEAGWMMQNREIPFEPSTTDILWEICRK